MLPSSMRTTYLMSQRMLSSQIMRGLLGGVYGTARVSNYRRCFSISTRRFDGIAQREPSIVPTDGLNAKEAQFRDGAATAVKRDTSSNAAGNGSSDSNSSGNNSGSRARTGSRIKRAWRMTKRTIIVGSVLASILFAVVVYRSRNPPEQAPFDPNKKTIVILGSGWGSTALLKRINTAYYNVIVVSPRNYFMFTPLLPSTTVGSVELRSIMEPLRHITRYKSAIVKTYEADCTAIDPKKKVIMIKSPQSNGITEEQKIAYDYLVVGVGAESATFGIPGVKEHSCFLKEVSDAQEIRARIIDKIETASLKDVDPTEKKRLLHTVVVGGGPTGIEFAGELRDFYLSDLKRWYPEIEEEFKVSLIEALPSVLPAFTEKLVQYTVQHFKKENIDIHTKTMVKQITEKEIIAEKTNDDGSKEKICIPYGLLVWAAGNSPRPLVKKLIEQIPEQKPAKRGLLVNEFLVLKGANDIWALGDCTSTKYAPTAQTATQQGYYLGNLFNRMAKVKLLEEEANKLKSLTEQMPTPRDLELVEMDMKKCHSKITALMEKMGSFQYSHYGNLAYIGSEKAIAELEIPWLNSSWASSGGATLLVWRSAYLSKIFSLRLRTLVIFDWLKARIFGRDISRE